MSSSGVRLKRAAISSLNGYIITYYEDEHPTFKNFITKKITAPPSNDLHVKQPMNAEEWELLLKNLEEIYKALKLPYRLVLLCSGSTGNTASKTIDLEAWFPAQKTYRELASCSNCKDFQSRRTNTKYKTKNNETDFLYTLNNTALAVQRTIACLLENNQQKDGSIKMPKVLHKYTGFKEIKLRRK